MKIQSVGATQDPSLAFCLYAPPGEGKTTFIGSGKNVLIIRPPQDHTDSIRSPKDRGIKEIVIRTWTEMNNLLVMAANGEFDKFEWVWLDSISLMQDQLLDSIWAEVIEAKPERKKFGIDRGEYGLNMQRLAQWVRAMAGMGTFNFGVTAHPFWGENIDGDELLMPYVQGKNMADKVCGCMNVVGFMEIRKLKLKGEDKSKRRRVINFDKTERYYAKDQFDAFEKGRLVDPTMPAFENAIKTARAKLAGKTTTTKRRAAGKTRSK